MLDAAGPSGRAVQGVGLRLLACWDRGFESHRGHGCLVCCECCVLSGRGLCDELITRSEDIDILLTVHLSIIYYLFPTWYTAFLSTYNICYPLSSTCFRPHRPIIRRSKLYMQLMVSSPSADVLVVWPLRKNSFSTAARQRHRQRRRVP